VQEGNTSYVYGLGLISQTTGTATSYPLADGLGSTAALTDSSGAVTATYTYDVFGAVKSSTGPGSTEFRFAGQQDDPALGYQYLRARYYDPATGRFIGKDPFSGYLTSPQTRNSYAYALNNPLNFTDPTGEVVAAAIPAGAWLVLGLGAALGIQGAATHQAELELAVSNAFDSMGRGVSNLIDEISGSCRGVQRQFAEAMEGSGAYGRTPAGRPFTRHYGTETGPDRNLPGSLVDHVIDSFTGKPTSDRKTVHYDPENDVTVVTGDGDSIVSVHKGPPRKGDR
jgi:RHS repeat-associated protein